MINLILCADVRITGIFPIDIPRGSHGSDGFYLRNRKAKSLRDLSIWRLSLSMIFRLISPQISRKIWKLFFGVSFEKLIKNILIEIWIFLMKNLWTIFFCVWKNLAFHMSPKFKFPFFDAHSWDDLRCIWYGI